MKAGAWRGGSTASPTYGIRVGASNRSEFFDAGWSEIEVEIDGQSYRFALTPGFWHQCPEFRDRGRPIIREWLRQNYGIDWIKGAPPKMKVDSTRG